MRNTENEISSRLSVLAGLEVSDVSHAADMLTLHFGPLKQYTTRRGTILEGGQWALHVQCEWRIERDGTAFSTRADLGGTDEATNCATERIRDLLVTPGPVAVEKVLPGASGDVCILMSGQIRLVITSDRIEGDEDWRFFSPGSDEKPLVIEGGAVDPWSL